VPFELILSFRGPRVETEDEVVEIEDALFELLGEGERWEGHEIDAAARTIHIATDDAQATFARLSPFLERAGLIEHVIAVARTAAGAHETMLWPSPR
jgi:hypothetical protein